MRELYSREFIGDIKIENLDPVGYKVSINCNKTENPTVIISDLPDEKFLPFIKEEIRNRKFHMVNYYSASKLPPENLNICK
jgi:hypothetical protein